MTIVKTRVMWGLFDLVKLSKLIVYFISSVCGVCQVEPVFFLGQNDFLFGSFHIILWCISASQLNTMIDEWVGRLGASLTQWEVTYKKRSQSLKATMGQETPICNRICCNNCLASLLRKINTKRRNKLILIDNFPDWIIKD